MGGGGGFESAVMRLMPIISHNYAVWKEKYPLKENLNSSDERDMNDSQVVWL